MKYYIKTTKDFEKIAEQLISENPKTYIIESRTGKHYTIERREQKEGEEPSAKPAIGYHIAKDDTEVQNPFYVEEELPDNMSREHIATCDGEPIEYYVVNSRKESKVFSENKTNGETLFCGKPFEDYTFRELKELLANIMKGDKDNG